MGSARGWVFHLDADKDGEVSFDEFQAAAQDDLKERSKAVGVKTLFKKLDADEDGKVSLEEAQTADAEINEEDFSAIDENGDGSVSPEELAVPLRLIEAEFKKVDWEKFSEGGRLRKLLKPDIMQANSEVANSPLPPLGPHFPAAVAGLFIIPFLLAALGCRHRRRYAAPSAGSSE